MTRRAVVLPVPDPVAEHVDVIRRAWDPVMAGRIGPHVTLVHHVVEGGDGAGLVTAAAQMTGPIEVTLGGTSRWAETSAYGVFLDVVDPAGAVVALQRRLATLEAPAWAQVDYRPHVTLVHGRTVDPARAEAAWQALRDLCAGWPITLTSIEVLELVEPDGWRLVERRPFAGPEASAAD